MDKELWMPVEEFCMYYQVEKSFIFLLKDAGLIEITVIENTGCIHANQLSSLEKFSRLHYELDINIEGIEAIYHLLERIKHLQSQLKKIKEQLPVPSYYESV